MDGRCRWRADRADQGVAVGQSAEALRARILDHLAREQQPELSDICIVRGPADFDPAMPAFVTAFLAQRFAGG